MSQLALRPRVRGALARILNRGLGRLGYMITRRAPEPLRPPDFEPQFFEIYDQCAEYTLTSIERMYALYQATRYVVGAGIPGDFVECGVWRGGSAMLCAMTLLDLRETDRCIYLFDTFQGMSPPSDKDIDPDGVPAWEQWERSQRDGVADWCYASLDEVQANMRTTGFAEDRLVFAKGKVEDTLPALAPETISLLRLDTDWYESTYHELTHLMPRLSQGGVLILDDYGYWAGARDATERYLNETAIPLFLTRVDQTARMAVKQ